MSAQKGRDLLLKLDSDGIGSFITVAGLRSHALAFNAEAIDITNQDSAGQWRELLSGGGIRQASMRGSGIFRDAASDAKIRELVFGGIIRDWQVVVPDFGTVTGPFQVTAFELSGRYDGEVTFDLGPASAGALSFAAL